MDLRVYYQKLRKVESEIEDPYVVIISRETPDGGRAGVKFEAPRNIAARLIVEEKAELASATVAAAFRADAERRSKAAAEASNNLSEIEVRALRSALRPARKA